MLVLFLAANHTSNENCMALSMRSASATHFDLLTEIRDDDRTPPHSLVIDGGPIGMIDDLVGIGVRNPRGRCPESGACRRRTIHLSRGAHERQLARAAGDLAPMVDEHQPDPYDDIVPFLRGASASGTASGTRAPRT